MSIKFKISKTPIEYPLGFLDWFVGSFKTVRHANADADVVMGVASKPASQIEQNQGEPDGMVKLATTSFQAQYFSWSSFLTFSKII
jgi:hypothetical protein